MLNYMNFVYASINQKFLLKGEILSMSYSIRHCCYLANKSSCSCLLKKNMGTKTFFHSYRKAAIFSKYYNGKMLICSLMNYKQKYLLLGNFWGNLLSLGLTQLMKYNCKHCNKNAPLTWVQFLKVAAQHTWLGCLGQQNSGWWLSRNTLSFKLLTFVIKFLIISLQFCSDGLSSDKSHQSQCIFRT